MGGGGQVGGNMPPMPRPCNGLGRVHLRAGLAIAGLRPSLIRNSGATYGDGVVPNGAVGCGRPNDHRPIQRARQQ